MSTSIKIGLLEVTISRDDIDQPFPIDVRVFEEDTYLVLSAPPEIREVKEHPIRLMTTVLEMEPKVRGRVVLDTPRRWLAVVHDLNEEPTTSEAWVRAAMDDVLNKVQDLGPAAMMIPPLGAVHHAISPGEAVDLVLDGLTARWTKTLRKVWLAVPEPMEAIAVERASRRSEETA